MYAHPMKHKNVTPALIHSHSYRVLSQLRHFAVGTRANSDHIVDKGKNPFGRRLPMITSLKRLPILTTAFVMSMGAMAAADDTNVIEANWYSFWGSAKYSEPFEHLDYVNPDAPKGGDFSMAWVGTFDSFNPYATLSGTPAVMSTVMYETLMAGTADEYKAAAYCLLCETIEYPESLDWVIFNLRDDVTFSDGSPMTAEDIAFSVDLILEQGTKSARDSIRAKIPSIEVLDEGRIKFNFAPDAPRKGLISQAGAFPVMQKKWFEETGARLDEKRYETSPGTGAYMLSADYEPGAWTEFHRNPDYWGIDHPLKKGTENYDTVRIEYFADKVAAFEAFKAGEVTFRLESSSLQWATGYDFPALDEEWVVKKELAKGSMPLNSGIMFNLRKPELQDRNVRRALGLMFNFTWTNATLQYDLFAQRESFWNAGGLAAAGLPEGQELAYLDKVRDLLPEEIFTQPALLPHTSGARLLDRRNMRQALALMEEAGYTPAEDGKLRNAAGENLKLEFLEKSPSFDRILLPYIENLKALGVDINYNRIDANEFQARSQSFDYDIIFDYYVNGFEEGSGLQQRFGSEDVDDIFNPAGYANPAVDALIDNVIRAETYEDMSAAVRAIDRVMRFDYFLVPTWYNDTHWVAHFDMYEHPPVEQMPPLVLGQLDFWWYNADKAEALKAAGAIK
jgi:microcin C transport system substrate-binding protein